jgi:DNA-binding transcriptional LysR family regulator
MASGDDTATFVYPSRDIRRAQLFPGARSSAGQSSCLLSSRSRVRILPGAPTTTEGSIFLTQDGVSGKLRDACEHQDTDPRAPFAHDRPVDARQLGYFLAVADHGSFNRAAASLYLAQPSLSQAIRHLERELDVLLFHRIGRRIELTEAGRAMIEPARQVLRDLETARATAESVKGLHTGRLEIASMPSPAVQPLATMIGAPPGTRARQLADEVRERGVPLRIGVEAAHREAVLPLVLQGAGVAVVTAARADLARGAGALVLDLEPLNRLNRR